VNKIRYGVIGVKGIGQVHAYLAQKHERVELTALVDVDADFVNRKSQELGVRGFTDYETCLRLELWMRYQLPRHTICMAKWD